MKAGIRKIAGAGKAGSGAYKIPPNPAAVRQSLRQAAKLEPSVLIGLLATLPAVANVPGIWEAAANLQAGAGGKLDKPASGAISRMIADSGKDWIARDQEAFVSAAERFKADLETYRYNVQWVAGHVDSIGDAIAAYWITAAKIAQETYLRLTALQVMALAPQSSVAARLAMRAAGAQSSAALARSTERLSLFLKAGVGGVAAAMGGPAIWQLGFMRTTATSRVDFAQAGIDTSDPARAATFRPPPPGSPLPDGAQYFDWRVKTPDGGRTLDEVAKDRLTP
ncbi:hypothetical protein AB0F17_21460 [Nonomuraea sp. NPDC026600]|uniref:hypothetical protein n=1 Tax=Nonomuraea sp. NPDC026600 TaxID=3155363 RepID=UPI0033F25BE3